MSGHFLANVTNQYITHTVPYYSYQIDDGVMYFSGYVDCAMNIPNITYISSVRLNYSGVYGVTADFSFVNWN